MLKYKLCNRTNGRTNSCFESKGCLMPCTAMNIFSVYHVMTDLCSDLGNKIYSTFYSLPNIIHKTITFISLVNITLHIYSFFAVVWLSTSEVWGAVNVLRLSLKTTVLIFLVKQEMSQSTCESGMICTGVLNSLSNDLECWFVFVLASCGHFINIPHCSFTSPLSQFSVYPVQSLLWAAKNHSVPRNSESPQ